MRVDGQLRSPREGESKSSIDTSQAFGKINEAFEKVDESLRTCEKALEGSIYGAALAGDFKQLELRLGDAHRAIARLRDIAPPQTLTQRDSERLAADETILGADLKLYGLLADQWKLKQDRRTRDNFVAEPLEELFFKPVEDCIDRFLKS